MRTIINYKNKFRPYLWLSIISSIILIPFIIVCFIGEFMIIKDIFILNKLDGLIFLVIPISVQLFICKYLESYILLADASTFNITFYNDRFNYIGLFKNKTIYYTEISSLTNLTLLLESLVVDSAIEIFQIEQKNKKKIRLSCKGISKEDAEKLKQDLTKYIGLDMDLKREKLKFFKKTQL